MMGVVLIGLSFLFWCSSAYHLGYSGEIGADAIVAAILLTGGTIVETLKERR